MSLKDQISNDLDAVFLNTNDFAEIREVEGKAVTCVVDDSFAPVKQGRILGLIEADVILSAKAADLPPERAPESILNVDGRELIVVKWGNSMGLAEVALRQNRTM